MEPWFIGGVAPRLVAIKSADVFQGLKISASAASVTRSTERLFDKMDFLDLDVRDLAEQLTLIEWTMFSKIGDAELHHLNWKKQNSLAPNVTAMTERFNKVSYWVSTEIVMQTDLRKRAVLLKKFIDIAEHMRDISNYNGLMEIIGGLNSLPISRLKATWEQLPRGVPETFNQLNTLMEQLNNFINYRNSLKVCRLPALPFLGVYLRDIVFLDEGNPNFWDEESTIVNFDKLQLLGTTFCDLKKFQTQAYPFEPNYLLQQYLLVVNNLTEEMLYKHSLLCENNPD